jgi:putative oxidoreductase
MSEGQSKAKPADIASALLRAGLALLLMVHSFSQLMAFWQAARMVNPGGFPNAAILAGAAVPALILVGAVLLVLGFKTRAVAIALILLVAFVSAADLMLFGVPSSALGWFARLSVMIGLLIPAVIGGGGLSIDGRLRAARAAR